MTRYIDIHDIRQLIAKIGLSDFIVQLAQTIRRDFERWQQFALSARVAHHSESGVIELMPMTDGVQYAFKYVNGHPKNSRYNMPTVMAFGALADVETGYPNLLSELTITTALRTAATSALAAQAQARRDASTMAIIGNGAQSEFQVLAFHALLGIREIRAYDIDPAATQKLIRNLAHVADLRIIPATSLEEAIEGADIITTATAAKTRATILVPDMIVPGAHINAICGDCPGKTELHPQILERARVVVEYTLQTRIEGEIQQMPEDFPVTELWQVLTKAAPGRTRDDEVTIFDSVGFALEDFSALRLIRELADTHDIGTKLALVPSNNNPKDLFQLLDTGGHSGNMAVSETPSGISINMKTILVIEDNPLNMKLAIFLLENAGYQTIQALNAEDGIRLAQEKQPDLILMDVQLPGMDGLTATRVLKKDDTTRGIKVIAMTACAMIGDRERIEDAGCDGYIGKPIFIQEFQRIVSTILVTEK